MKREEVDLHLQTLFRNKNPKHTQAACAFFTNSDQSDIFPEVVETPKGGIWTLVESGADKIMYQYKIWAIYERKLEGWEDAGDGEDLAGSSPS